MQIQINTDSNIEGNTKLLQQFDAVLRNELDRFSEQITRVEVHLSDRNSDKKFGADDMRCLLEARLAGIQPVSVSDSAGTLEKAVEGAVGKLTRLLDSSLGKIGAH